MKNLKFQISYVHLFLVLFDKEKQNLRHEEFHDLSFYKYCFRNHLFLKKGPCRKMHTQQNILKLSYRKKSLRENADTTKNVSLILFFPFSCLRERIFSHIFASHNQIFHKEKQMLFIFF